MSCIQTDGLNTKSKPKPKGSFETFIQNVSLIWERLWQNPESWKLQIAFSLTGCMLKRKLVSLLKIKETELTKARSNYFVAICGLVLCYYCFWALYTNFCWNGNTKIFRAKNFRFLSLWCGLAWTFNNMLIALKGYHKSERDNCDSEVLGLSLCSRKVVWNVIFTQNWRDSSKCTFFSWKLMPCRKTFLTTAKIFSVKFQVIQKQKEMM